MCMCNTTRQGTTEGNIALGHEACEGCAKIGFGTHVISGIGGVSGAPYGALKRVRGAPQLAW
eukprot:7408923-Pyramimonas_sp.AAC.1